MAKRTFPGPGAVEEKPEAESTSRQGDSSRRILILTAEAGLVLVLLILFLASDRIQSSTNLFVLFLYSFPSEFLVGLVPHEPVLIFFGQEYAPWVVALVAGVGTVMAEGLNYSFFGLFYGIPTLRAAFRRRAVIKIADLFRRAPFSAILFCGFSPVPFFPIRFLVVITAYPVGRYLLGVFLSRTPRFYLLALLGAVFEVPGVLLLAFFAGMLLLVNLPALTGILRSPEAGMDGVEG